MARKPREKSETGIYHVIVRGINQQDIFHDEEDFKKYTRVIKKAGSENDTDIIGYCIMTNHVHLLLRENDDNLSSYMKSVQVSYVSWYNSKYERCGHLFQDRFKSEAVENDAYLLTVIRYIHNNPVKAGIVKKPELYPWSSCANYYGVEMTALKSIDTQLVLGIFSKQKEKAIEKFREFMNEPQQDQCMEYNEDRRLNEKEVYQLTAKLMDGRPVTAIQTLDPESRSLILHKLRYDHGASIRQISRVTGIPMHLVRKI